MQDYNDDLLIQRPRFRVRRSVKMNLKIAQERVEFFIAVSELLLTQLQRFGTYSSSIKEIMRA